MNNYCDFHIYNSKLEQTKISTTLERNFEFKLIIQARTIKIISADFRFGHLWTKFNSDSYQNILPLKKNNFSKYPTPFLIITCRVETSKK